MTRWDRFPAADSLNALLDADIERPERRANHSTRGTPVANIKSQKKRILTNAKAQEQLDECEGRFLL